LAIARWRGARPRELLRPLTALAVALLCVELLKLAVYHERPFSVGPAQHDSFPSGDTAQVALCAATALHLVALRRIARDRVRWGLVLVGAMTAIAVAFSRVYLGRHWASDVAASLPIGFVFWSAAPRWPPSVGKLAFTVAGIAVLLVSGPPLVFPSPMAFDDQRHFDYARGLGGEEDLAGQREMLDFLPGAHQRVDHGDRVVEAREDVEPPPRGVEEEAARAPPPLTGM
jgi:hypothetical protein